MCLDFVERSVEISHFIGQQAGFFGLTSPSLVVLVYIGGRER